MINNIGQIQLCEADKFCDKAAMILSNYNDSSSCFCSLVQQPEGSASRLVYWF